MMVSPGRRADASEALTGQAEMITQRDMGFLLSGKYDNTASFSVSFCRCLWYTGSAVHPRYLTGEGVEILAYLMAFLVAVAADVAGHIICKWLDRYDDDRKPN